jgi:hypothetical protein
MSTNATGDENPTDESTADELTRVKRSVPATETVHSVLTEARVYSPDDGRVHLWGRLSDTESLPDSFLTPLLFAAHKRENTDSEILDGTIQVLVQSPNWEIEGESVTVETEILADRETQEIQAIGVSTPDSSLHAPEGCGCDGLREGKLSCWECYQQGIETVRADD